MKGTFIILLMLLVEKALACSCATSPLVQRVAHSDFVGVAKIVGINPDPKNEMFHDLDIEIIELFKGERLSSLKIRSALNTSCAFFADENTTWLIFASRDKNGILSFGFCSGSLQFDRYTEATEYPDAAESFKRSLELKLSALRYMKQKGIVPVNEFNLHTFVSMDCLKAFNGYDLNERFAIYQVTVNPDLSIGEIKPLKEFGNTALKAGLPDCIENEAKVWSGNPNDSIPHKTHIIIIFYYYPAEKKDESFIGPYDI